MLEISVKANINPRLRQILQEIGPMTRRELFSVGANGLRIAVRRHLRREGAIRHATAGRLGAEPTQHIIKGAARVTSFSSEHGAVVSVPIAGITRAYRDLTILPVQAKALTIPIAAASYCHRVRELSRLGWNVFRPNGSDVLFGRRDGDETATALYALKKSVVVRRDRTLLPDDETIADAINIPMIKSIQLKIRGAA